MYENECLKFEHLLCNCARWPVVVTLPLASCLYKNIPKMDWTFLMIYLRYGGLLDLDPDPET